jgi:RNase H-fold protein (predicted Holliday junction resolvase)
MRILAIDHCTKRMGIDISDELGTITLMSLNHRLPVSSRTGNVRA